MGMDVDAVETAGRNLKSQAGELQTKLNQIDALVRNLTSIWDGKDANEFVNSWWPEHKRSLTTVISHIDGLGQSALNNANEQRDVSGR
ncbi:WXG100 family type VII secretion target [Microbacteriaceae bacterium VKM Ac-2854]|nr:WXG100 family type VII secretion target [Microbacteriaceae bacterium VKM Ac-2854]